MLFNSLIPQLPSNPIAIAIFISSLIGVILLLYSQFVETENHRDLIRMIGAFGLFVYSLSILNLVFIIASLGIFIAALVEFIEIYLGYHRHIRQTKEEIYDYIKNRK